MTTPELLYLALIAATLAFDHCVLWRTFLRRCQHDAARARVRLWSGWMVMLWMLTLVGLALWVGEHRSWGLIGFALPHGWRLLGAIGLVLTVGVLQALSVTKIAHASDSRRAGLREKFGSLAAMGPHSGSDLRLFIPLAVSAGFCEEFLFRGYLLWFLRTALGLWAGAALSVIAFAAGHAYQGVKGVASAGILGALFTLIVLAFGSLWPAIALHALVDISGGLTSWLTFREWPLGEGEARVNTGVI